MNKIIMATLTVACLTFVGCNDKNCDENGCVISENVVCPEGCENCLCAEGVECPEECKDCNCICCKAS